MQTDSIDVQVRAVVPTGDQTIVFVGNPQKTFAIPVDNAVGQALVLAFSSLKTFSAFKQARPQTHDLLSNICAGFGIAFERMVINDYREQVFYARIFLRMKNEVGVKFIEVDSRASDAIVLALNAGKPIAVAKKVFDRLEDAAELLKKLSPKKK